MLKKIVLILVIALNAYSSSCWTSVELSELAQDGLNNKASMSIKDAITCKPIPYAKFYLGRTSFKADKNGIVTLPLPPMDMDRNLPIRIEKSGYITAKEQVLVTLGSYWNNLFLMSKALPIESVRIVLSWGSEPQDLDLHLKARDFHISFQNTKNIENVAKLDRDAMKGYGPETITIDKLHKNETYKILVNRYSSIGEINNKTQIRVYKNNKVDRVVRLKRTSTRCIEIASIHNNKIVYETKYLQDEECK